MKVIISAKFPQIKPAHHAFISKHGQRSCLRIAVKDAIDAVLTDERLKGRRATALAPFTFTVALIAETTDD